jgi:hypothetical protein
MPVLGGGNLVLIVATVFESDLPTVVAVNRRWKW